MTRDAGLVALSAADIRRSTPGYVYGVAIHSSHREEATPPCACPCHLAKTPDGVRGWYCDRCYKGIVIGSWPESAPVDYSHDQAISDGITDPRPYVVAVPDYYFVTGGNNLGDALGEHFDSEQEASARAEELNRADVLATLDLTPQAAERRKRLQGLGETFCVRYGEGHPEARWPSKPSRYAVETWSDRYSESFWGTYETLDEVREEIASGDVTRVVDLDTGADVSFTVTVAFDDAPPKDID